MTKIISTSKVNLLIQCLENNSKNFPNQIAYTFNDKYITNEELWKKSNHYASLLKKQGTSPVVIICDKSIENYVLIIASLISGRAYVPVDFNTPEERLKKIIESCNSTLCLKTENLNDLEKFENFPEQNVVTNFVYIIFTSGSTGTPKGVPITVENLNNFCSWILNIPYLRDYENKIILSNSSFSFDLSVFSICYGILKCQTFVATDLNFKNLDFSFNHFVKEATVISGTPSFFKMLLLDENFSSKHFSNLEFIFSIGETLDSNLAKKIFSRFPSIKLFNSYGPTEATCAVCGSFIDCNILNENDLPMGDLDSAAIEIKIVNQEIVLKGKSVSDGYLENETLKSFFVEDGLNCFKTSDLAYLKNNQIYFMGRKDSQIKYLGYRIDLLDIESNIKSVDGVEDAIVTKSTNKSGIVTSINALVVSNLSIEKIKNEISNKLPSYMIPKKIDLVDKIPLNQHDKKNREEL